MDDVKDIFLEHNMRLTPDAEEYLSSKTVDEIKSLMLTLLEQGKIFVTINDVKQQPEKKIQEVTVIRSQFKEVPSREHSSNYKIHWDKDISGKSRATGTITNFIENVQNKYTQLSGIIRGRMSMYQTLTLKKIGTITDNNEKVRAIVMVNNKRITKKGNILFEVEDETDNGRVIITQNDKKLTADAAMVNNDAVVGFEGSMYKGMIIADKIIWPDIPLNHKLEPINEQLSVMYLADTHIGSKMFLDKVFHKAIDWVKKGGDIAGKVKYVCIAGDLVDGVGTYPKQESEVVVMYIYEQYKMFGEYIQEFPEHNHFFIIPGNHDAVRRAQPQPRIPKELIDLNGRVHLMGCPAWVRIEKYLHLLYHGDSLDSIIATLPGLDYKRPEEAMVELSKRRHLSPVYGNNPIVPENPDYMVIDDVPDIVNMGHLHKNGFASYRNVYHIASGTFQSRTEYQEKFGHVPTPGVVTVFDMNTLKVTNINFMGA